jgi:hypothetical protein
MRHSSKFSQNKKEKFSLKTTVVVFDSGQFREPTVLMGPGLQIGNELPDLLFAEMSSPGGHDRALRTVGLDLFADLDAPEEIRRINLPVMDVSEIRGRWLKENSTIRSSLARFAMASGTLAHEQLLAEMELICVRHQAGWHLPVRVSHFVFLAPGYKKCRYSECNRNDYVTI